MSEREQQSVIDFRCCRGFCDIREEAVFTALLGRVGKGEQGKLDRMCHELDVADSHLVLNAAF